MSIRERTPAGATPEYEHYRRKANQHWEMAGVARQDNDAADSAKHTALAREFDALAAQALRGA